MRGGKRTGAGRKVGAVTKRTQEIAAQAAAEGITPLEFLLNTMRDDKKDFAQRLSAAKDAAPYVHPRLAAIEHKGDKESPMGFIVLSAVPRDDEHEGLNGHANGRATHN